MSIKDEIPCTEFGLNTYINYAIKQIKKNTNHSKRLKTRMQWCKDKAEEMGIKLTITEKEKTNAN